MYMNKNNNTNYTEKLKSDNPLVVKETLIELREKGNKEFIPTLIELLHKYKDTDNESIIKNFISDIKDSAVKDIIIDYLQDHKYANIKRDLLTVCWESRFDFGEHLSLFVDILINDEFMTAFEAFTVIENLASDIEEEKKNTEISKLKEAALKAEESRQLLLHDAIHIIPEIRYTED